MKFVFLRRILFLLLLIPITGLICSASTDSLPPSTSVSDPWFEYTLDIKDVRVVEDPESSFTPMEVLSLSADGGSQPDSLYFGYTSSAYWLVFDVDSDGSSRFFVTEHYGLDRIEVWTIHPDSDGPVLQGIAGWRHRDAGMEPAARYAISTVPIPTSSGRPHRVLLKIESTTSLAPDIVLYGEDSFTRASGRVRMVQGASVGVACLMLILSVLIFVSSPRSEFFLFIVLVVLSGLAMIYLNGVGPLVLWPHWPILTYIVSLPLFPCLVAVSIRFFRRLFNLASGSRYSRMLSTLEYLLYFQVVFVLFLPMGLAFRINNVVMLISLSSVFVFLFIAFLKRIQVSRLLFSAWSVLILAGVYANFQYSGLLPPVLGFHNVGLVLSLTIILQNSILGATIVVLSERSRRLESSGREDAEQRNIELMKTIVEGDRMDGLADLVSVVFHEMSTPLGYSRLLGSELKSRSDQFREQLSSGSPGMSDLEDLLKFASESGGLIENSLGAATGIMDGYRTVAADEAKVDIKVVNIGHYISLIEKMMQPFINKKGHSLQVEVETVSPIKTIPGFLTQVLNNLIVNAMTHAYDEDEKGRIFLRVCPEGPDRIHISVEDEGRGIPEDISARIFDTYFTTAENRGGTGLGLGIVRHLVEDKLKGRLFWQSTPGKGSIFTVSLSSLEESPSE